MDRADPCAAPSCKKGRPSGDVGYRPDTSQSIRSLQSARGNCRSVSLSDFCILPCIGVHLKPKYVIKWKTEVLRPQTKERC